MKCLTKDEVYLYGDTTIAKGDIVEVVYCDGYYHIELGDKGILQIGDQEFKELFLVIN